VRKLTRRQVLPLLAAGVTACAAPSASTSSNPATSSSGGVASATATSPTTPASSRPVTATGASGTGASNLTTPATTSAAKQAAAIKPGGTLRLGLPDDLSGLDGHVLSRDHYDSIWNVWDRLTAYNDKLEPQPGLAESWEISSDSTQYKLNLRRGVTWHSGREFTSNDVKWNLDRLADPKVGFGQLKNLHDWFPNVELPDKNTIILKSDAPRPNVFDYFELFNILDPITMQGPDATSKAVGTGPFVFQEWQQGTSLKLTKNPNYWDSSKPNLDGITWSLRVDPQALVVQLEAGSLDGIKAPPVNDFVRLKQDPVYQSLVHPATGAYYCVGFNCTVPPFDNPKVRQAFNWALNRQRFTDQILKGIVKPFSLPWPASSGAYEADKANHYTFDLDKAGALLREAGVTGLETTLLLNTGLQELVEFAPIYQADLASIGVKLSIQVVEVAAWISAVNTLQYNAVYASTGSFAQLRSPNILFSSGPVWGPQQNNTGFRSDQYAALVTQAGSEVDPAKQKQIYSQLNDLLLDQTFVTTLAPNPPRETFRAEVKNISYSAHEGFVYTTAGLAS
jgi:peptide/nickel transport system substrate-binding protein